MKKKKSSMVTTRMLTTIAILAAISSILFMIEVPVIAFYKMDFSNLPVLLGTFAMGPLAGTLVLGVKSIIGLLHSSSQGVGELADFLIGFAMVLPAGLIYMYNKTRGGALLGMGIGSLIATVVAVLANVYIMVPFYGIVYGMPVEVIVQMGQKVIPAVDSLWKFVFYITAPFNLMKWLVLSIIGGVMYKPLSPLLHGRETVHRYRGAKQKEKTQA